MTYFSRKTIPAVTLGLGSDEVKLVFFEGHDFTRQMVRKILHP